MPFIVSFDVSRAYDNVDVSQLLLLVEPLLQQPQYLMVKYAEVGRCSPQLAAIAMQTADKDSDASSY